jgi:hypothetical protein
MQLKELLAEIMSELDQPMGNIDLNKIQSKMYLVAGLLTDDDTKVPVEVFDLFPEEYKKSAIILYMKMIAQTLAEG